MEIKNLQEDIEKRYEKRYEKNRRGFAVKSLIAASLGSFLFINSLLKENP